MTALPAAGAKRRTVPTALLRAVIEDYGAVRVIGLALVAMVRPSRRRRRPVKAATLSDRIRTDIGLPPATDPPSYWPDR